MCSALVHLQIHAHEPQSRAFTTAAIAASHNEQSLIAKLKPQTMSSGKQLARSCAGKECQLTHLCCAKGVTLANRHETQPYSKQEINTLC